MTEFNPEPLRVQTVPQTKESSLAIVSLVTGITGWIFLPFIGALTAVITGHIAKKEIRDGNGTITGGGMATAGLILGYVQLGLVVLSIIVIVVLALLAPNIQNVFDSINSTLQP
jgi:hypothetical protein